MIVCVFKVLVPRSTKQVGGCNLRVSHRSDLPFRRADSPFSRLNLC